MANRRVARGRAYKELRERWLRDLEARGELICYRPGCGPMFMDVPKGHRHQATVDHVITVSTGYNDLDTDNWLPCCYHHNSRRGNRPISSIMPPVRRSRDW